MTSSYSQGVSSKPWIIHKFGGTSVGNAERYKGVAKILEPLSSKNRLGVVVSAMKGVTDRLIELVELARTSNPTYEEKLKLLHDLHVSEAGKLLLPARFAEISKVLERDFGQIKEILRGVFLARSSSERIIELVAGHGEIWSAQFLNAHLNDLGKKSVWLDAREILIVEPLELRVNVLWEQSQKKTDAWFSKNPSEIVIITGFVASTPEGIPTTLKRNGSDFTASIVAALLNAAEIQIWTDVDGVLSADPGIVSDAVVLKEMSFQEVTELAYFGAKVVHPATMEPAFRKNIPIRIKNTFRPEVPGTLIHSDAKSDATVKGFSAIENMSIINLEGTGMIGVPGIAERLFGELKSVGVSVVMISQASSEHSICFVVPDHQAETAKKAAETAFFAEIQKGLIQKIELSRSNSILAAVGDNMARRPGVASRLFSALADAQVNVRVIAQGSSERNISVVIPGADTKRALRVVHSAFYLSNQTISVGLIGAGLIGSALLTQLESQAEFLARERKIDIRVRGIINSAKMVLNEKGVTLAQWKTEKGEKADLQKFLAFVKPDFMPHAVLIDATASAEISQGYLGFLDAGFHLITPNKKANSGSYSVYEALKKKAREKNRHFLYATNVGAGLPILQTVRDLRHTGDEIIEVEGILSGTLSYLFNTFDGTRPFSEILLDAKLKGYTEPDPREDLSGMDFARKVVIVAREAGMKFELSDVNVQNLVSSELQKLSLDEYLKRVSEADAYFSEKFQSARKNGKQIRYIGKISSDRKLKVELTELDESHPFLRLKGSDNIVAIRTKNYNKQPLIIQGPGAGPEVTAGGVFADLLRLASYLGAAP